jgi:FAD binding domain-containing protein/berberine-like enzyme
MRYTAPGVTIDQGALVDLASEFRGDVIQPGEIGYDDHRAIWNGSIDRHPAVILRSASAQDVRNAVGFARRSQMPVAVRGGGHSFPGHSTCDGVLIDLSPMRGIRVDPIRRTVRAQAGVLLGELDRETQAFGLAVPAGIVTHTGLAGLTLGGGIGWLQRKYGLTIDNLLSVDLVTASGEPVTASAERNPELFWGVRGGGGNFGIVTEFEFQLQPVGPTVVAGPIVWPIEDSGDVLRYYRDWITDVPDELTTIVVHRWIPAIPAFPAELHGKPAVFVIACWCGPVEDGLKVLAPMKSYGKPLLDLCEPKPFLTHQSMFDPSFPHGRWYYIRSTDVAELTDDVIDIAVEAGAAISGPLTSYPIFHKGGAIARVDEDATAFGGRQAGHTFNFVASTETADGFEEQRDWVRRFSKALEPHRVGVYLNFLGDEGDDTIREMYGATKYARLQALKREYDPDNLFHLNQNIPPG